MSNRVPLSRCILGALGVLCAAPRAQAEWQPGAIVVVSPVVPPPGPDRSTPVHLGLLATGIGTLVLSYGLSATVSIGNDHKGDVALFVPVLGPWLDLSSRSCVGPTLDRLDGPVEAASLRPCGASAFDEAMLVASGVVQGLGALQIMASFFVSQDRPRGLERPVMPRFAIVPTAFGGRGVGAMARGRF